MQLTYLVLTLLLHGYSYAAFCPEIEPIQYGDVTSSEKPPYKVGTILSFKCDKGFKGHGKGQITCLKDGRWSDPVPYCTAFECTRDNKRVEKGRKCKKKCKKDSQCKGSFKKCLCDDWCGKTCYDPAGSCEELKAPENGYLVGSEFSYGYTVTYGCSEGFMLTGPATRRCRADREWSGFEPKCVAFSACGQPGDEDDTLFSPKVIEGTNAKEGAWPWQSLLFHNLEHSVEQIYNRNAGFGGGSIIDNKWILTAAHLFDQFPHMFRNKNFKNFFLVAVGFTSYPEPNHIIPEYVNVFEPGNVYRHEEYNSVNYDYDVALIRIGKRLKRDGRKFVVDDEAPEDEFVFSRYVRPVCLPCMNGNRMGAVDIWRNFDRDQCNPRGRSFLSALVEAGNFVMVTGFGWKRNPGENYQFRPKKLQEGLLKVIDDLLCVASVKQIQREVSEARYTDRMMCAGSVNETSKIDSCQGDSGGPLVKQFDINEHIRYWLQVGIVSWGWGCGNKHPGYYTSVTSIMSWVWKIIDDTRIGTWYNWSPWAPCDVTCGSGIERRTRVCMTKNCIGEDNESRKCNNKPCPTPGQCPPISAPEHGSYVKDPPSPYIAAGSVVTFTCDEGKFLKDGPTTITCQPNLQWSDTRKTVCVDEWGPWTTWSSCTSKCNGARYKTRTCARSSNVIMRLAGCKGNNILYQDCEDDPSCGQDTKCGSGGDLCLQGDINVDSGNVVNHALTLLNNLFGGRKK